MYCLAQSLDKMTNAYVDKYMTTHDQGPQPNATAATTVYNTKLLSPDELDTVINRCVCVCVCAGGEGNHRQMHVANPQERVRACVQTHRGCDEMLMCNVPSVGCEYGSYQASMHVTCVCCEPILTGFTRLRIGRNPRRVSWNTCSSSMTKTDTSSGCL